MSYTYDANGNLTSRGGDAFTWDHEDRLKSATIGGVTTTYTYNGDGLRVSKTTGGVTTSYVWDVAAKVPVVLQDGTNTYVYGLGLISMTDGSGNQTYRLTDGLGSTVNLTDGAGAITGSYTYDVFGAVRSHAGASTEYSFTGEDNDPNGLEYLRARYYDNGTGRFLSGDPLGAAYRYAGNNPVNMVDPTGLYPICGAPSDYGPLPCFDSTEVYLPLCSDWGDCRLFQSAHDPDPYKGIFQPLVASFGNACVSADATVSACRAGFVDERDMALADETAISVNARYKDSLKMGFSPEQAAGAVLAGVVFEGCLYGPVGTYLAVAGTGTVLGPVGTELLGCGLLAGLSYIMGNNVLSFLPIP